MSEQTYMVKINRAGAINSYFVTAATPTEAMLRAAKIDIDLAGDAKIKDIDVHGLHQYTDNVWAVITRP